MRARFDPAPKLIVVEPENAACLLESAKSGEVIHVKGELDTIMAGLACGEPSFLAWQELQRAATGFMAIPDQAAAAAVRFFAGNGLIFGESGVAGLAGCLLASRDTIVRAQLGLDSGSRILLFGTEGATDPDAYEQIVTPANKS